MNMNTDETAHDTQDGYCCACEYDIAVMDDKIREAVALREQEIVASIRERAYAGTKNTDIQGEAIADIAANTKGEAWELGYEAGIETAITIITKKD